MAWGGDGMPGVLRAPQAAPRALSEVLNAEGSWRAGSEWARVSIVASNCEHLRGDGRVWGSGEARAVSASPIISLKCLDSTVSTEHAMLRQADKTIPRGNWYIKHSTEGQKLFPQNGTGLLFR